MRLRILLCFLMASAPAWPQRITASLDGLVRDPSQAVVPGAAVRVTNANTGVVFRTTTDQDGRFQAPSLQPGPYGVAIEAKGFKRLERSGIVLNVDQTAELDFTLELGATSESVQITGEAPLLDAVSSELGQVVDNQSIVNLPLNQRNPLGLIMLAPNVSGSVGTTMTGLQFNVDGGRSGTTDVLLDGVSSSPPTDSYNALAIFPSVDAVQEFKVQLNNYSAEFGLTGGGVINLIYKSGSNAFHGSAYEFLRNSVMDANNFFTNKAGQPLASFKRSQFGFSLGGPVILPHFNGRNKTFFFVDYEGLRQRSAANLLTSVPTAAERTGNFSQIKTNGGSPITIYNPYSTTLISGVYTRTPFAGNIIPPSMINPVAANVAAYWPLANLPGGGGGQISNYATSSAAPYDIDQFDVKLDEIVSDRHRFSLRFSERDPTQSPAIFLPQAIAIAQNAVTNTSNAKSAAFNYTFSKSPTDLIEFRYGISDVLWANSILSNGFDPTQLGFPSYIRANANALGFPGFEFTNYYSIGVGSQLGQGVLGMMTQTWGLSNTKILSSHTLKFGAEVRALTNDTNQLGRSTGDYSFATTLTQGPNALAASSTAGDDFATFLLGLPGGTLTHNFKIIDTVSQYVGGYFQDDWKVTNRLTLNMGVRYELFVPRVERHNRSVDLDLTDPSPLAGPSGMPNLKGGLAYVGVNGYPRSQFDTQWTNFSPRFGFAYQAAKRMVVRGGYGIFYSLSESEAAATVSATGFRTDSTVYGTIDGVTPAYTLSNPFPNGFVPVTGSSLGLATATGTSISGALRHDPTPYMQNRNLGVQYQIPGDWLVEASYTGSRGVDLIWGPSFNQLPTSYMSMGSQLLQTVPNPFYGVITNSGPLSGATVQLRYLLAPFPQFTGVGWGYQPGASSSYNALIVRLEKRVTKNLGMLLSFTKGKMMDDCSSNNTGNFNGNGTVQNAYNRRGEWSLSTADIAERFVGSFVYNLPVGHGKQFGAHWNRLTDAFLGGWQLNGIVSAQTGNPLALSASNVANIFNPGERPNNNGKSAKLSGSVAGRLSQYFTTADFSQPATYTLGNVSRTLPDVRTPGLANLDVSLFKHFAITERLNLEFRAESFNVFNTPQFGGPNTSVTSSSFGVITSQANAPRQIQLALKLLF